LEKEAVRKIAMATEVVDGEWEESHVVGVDGFDDRGAGD
jgi:hypothetical protein